MIRKFWMIAVALLLAAPSSTFAQGSTAFLWDTRLGAGDNGLYTATPADPTTDFTFVGGPIPDPASDYTVFGMDFDAAGTLFVVDNNTKTLGTLDPITAAFTTIAAITGDYDGVATHTGLDAISPTMGYLSTTDTLYMIDLTTGVTTLIGTMNLGDPANEFVIEIASDSSGNLYAFSIFNRATDPVDNGLLYSVDTADASLTFIGRADVDSINFAQGMDVDPDTDILYVSFYTGGGTGTYGTWDTSDGSYTEVLNNADFPEDMENEMAIFGGQTHGMNNRLGNYVTFAVSDPLSNFTSISQPVAPLITATDFNETGDTLYAIDNANSQVGTIDQTTGLFTFVASLTGDFLSDTSTVVNGWGPDAMGITCDPTGPQFYLTSTTSLYTLDVTTGDTVLVDRYDGATIADPEPDFVVGIACNSAGEMYIRSTLDFSLWSVDKTTADATVVGTTTIDALEFPQGMDFDPMTDVLYDQIYTGGGTGQWGTWDLGTGVFTSIATNADFPPDGDGYTFLPAIQPFQSGPVVVAGESLTVMPGVISSGGLEDLTDSDNVSLVIFRDPQSTSAVTQFLLTSTSPTATPTSFEFTLEGRCVSRPNIVQRVEFFDYDLGVWEVVDEQNAVRMPPDLSITVAPTGDLSRFVNQTTLEIQAQIRYRADSPRANFSSRTDQAVWTIE